MFVIDMNASEKEEDLWGNHAHLTHYRFLICLEKRVENRNNGGASNYAVCFDKAVVNNTAYTIKAVRITYRIVHH